MSPLPESSSRHVTPSKTKDEVDAFAPFPEREAPVNPPPTRRTLAFWRRRERSDGQMPPRTRG
jgi:hypothetical protein